MNPILIQIGNLKIYWYSVMILIGIILGSNLIIRENKKQNMSMTKISDMIFFSLIFGIIGARIYYVLFNISYYKNDLLSIFKFWEGGLAIHGGIIAGTIYIIIYTKKHSLNTLKIFDIFAPGIIIGQAIGRWGNFFNSEAHGPITTLEHLKNQHIPQFVINGMQINNQYYIPTFYYESLWCLAGLILILIIRRLSKIKNGQIVSIYLIWYGIGRFIIESLRTDSLMLNTLKQAQIISVLMIIVGIILIITSIRNQPYNKENANAKNI